MRIFSPDDSRVETFPTNAWSGRINRSKKPFKDGFSSNSPLPPSSSLQPTEDVVGYVEDAVKGVVAGFPKSQVADPKWAGATTVRGQGILHGNCPNAR